MQSKIFCDVCRNYTAPVLLNYIWWILKEADKRKIDKLYFLARDGFIMQQIAVCLCEIFNLSIQCRYLYTSRAALRMPTYHLIGDEAYELLLGYSYQVTPDSMLQRALLSETTRTNILVELGVPEEKRNILLTRLETMKLAEKIRKNALYRDSVQSQSKQAYPITIDYFKQEGMMDNDIIAIVDSGWNGSMQRSLRQLLDAEGYEGKLVGFYFGLFQEPQFLPKSEYFTWFFGPNRNQNDKIRFSNNLFECICAAPHGTTLGYKRIENTVRPVLASTVSNAQNEFIQSQIDLIIQAIYQSIKEKKFDDFDKSNALKQTRILMRKLMYYPTPEIVIEFQKIMFCDDIYESYFSPLASMEQVNNLREYTICKQLRRALKRDAPRIKDIPWPYGVAALLPFPQRQWYRWNILFWEYLKNSIARKIYSKLKRSLLS